MTIWTLIQKRLGPYLKGIRKKISKGSLKDPFCYLGIISIILFGILSLGANFIFNSFSPLSNLGEILRGSFLDLPAKELSKVNGQNLFLGQSRILPREFPELVFIQGSGLKGVSPPVIVTPKVLGVLIGDQTEPETRKEIIEYQVEEGDSLWSIATKFNISSDTIVWANNIKSTLIRPGQKLLILPVSGVMHLVKEGDTISTLSEKYKVDPEKIITFNHLAREEDLLVGEVLIIPGGKMPSYSESQPVTSSRLSTNNFYGKSAAYPYGQCTWWVAQKRAIPSWGHAKNWLERAIASGYPVCKGRYCLPQVGAVISLGGNKTYGHVGYVEQVRGDKVVFSEMNYIGLGKMNYRTLTIGDPSIEGYIY